MKYFKYSPERVEEICKYISEGLSQKDAAILSGIGESTLYYWKSESKENPSPLSEKDRLALLESLKRAEAENKRRHIINIDTASNKSWQASAWWLERKYKDEFAVRSEVTGGDGEKLQIVLDMPK